MPRVNLRTDSQWLAKTLEALRNEGFMIVEGVLESDFIDETTEAMYRAQQAIHAEVGKERLERAGELGVLRLMMKFEPSLLKFLEISSVLDIVDNTVSNTAIMHLQNGFILPSFPPDETPEVFQNNYHPDFPRVLNGYMASINIFFALVDFEAANGATKVVPGTHQRMDRPSLEYCNENAIDAECPRGSMLVFDSTLWHAAGKNTSGDNRLSINHQFTRSYIKQQIDYVRALGHDLVLQQPDRTQQLLGWYTRVVTSLDEYYQPSEKRLYRAGQG